MLLFVRSFVCFIPHWRYELHWQSVILPSLTAYCTWVVTWWVVCIVDDLFDHRLFVSTCTTPIYRLFESARLSEPYLSSLKGDLEGHHVTWLTAWYVCSSLIGVQCNVDLMYCSAMQCNVMSATCSFPIRITTKIWCVSYLICIIQMMYDPVRWRFQRCNKAISAICRLFGSASCPRRISLAPAAAATSSYNLLYFVLAITLQLDSNTYNSYIMYIMCPWYIKL